jgi:UDP-3-O-[3-hydroxymyristoyl] N-acetylglucosamine deacetylase
MIRQRSIKTRIHAVGIGLHSGQRVDITFRPAPVNTGIIFRRVDLSPSVDIPISAHSVCDTRMASTIGHQGIKVQTVEHLLSACCGLGIDNLYIDINAEEVPILDGSAASFVFLLQHAGIFIQEAPKAFLRVLKPIKVYQETDKEIKWAKLYPYSGYKLSFEIDFNHPVLDLTNQSSSFDMGSDNYVRQIARARTFGFTRDVEALRSHGLALGGGLDNAIVMDDYRMLNTECLRYEDEFTRHKILDAIGDLYLVGKPLLAHYKAYRSGHALNNQLLLSLLNDETAYELIRFTDENQLPKGFSSPNWVFTT